MTVIQAYAIMESANQIVRPREKYNGTWKPGNVVMKVHSASQRFVKIQSAKQKSKLLTKAQ